MGLEVSSVGRREYSSSSTKDTRQVCQPANKKGFSRYIKGEDSSYDCYSSSKRCSSPVPFLKLTCTCNAENPEVKKDIEQNVKKDIEQKVTRSYLFIK